MVSASKGIAIAEITFEGPIRNHPFVERFVIVNDDGLLVAFANHFTIRSIISSSAPCDE